jgi:hypothetical protein
MLIARRRVVLDEEHDVVEQRDQLVRDSDERRLGQLLETLRRHRDHGAIVTDAAGLDR